MDPLHRHLVRDAHVSLAALIAALTLVSAVPLAAQGRIVARPCAQPRPMPDAMPNGMAVPCGTGIVRTATATTVTLADRVLRYEITETFRNTCGAVAEADYMFPLPAGAAFEDLKLSINGEMVAGETMTADRARGIYEEIVRRQRDPALVEWMGSGLLRARIFPIAPGEEKRVVVRYQSVATREGDAIRIDYRRGSDPSGGRTGGATIVPIDRRTGRIAADEDSETTWSRFALVYPRSDRYGTPYSPTHSLRIRDDANTRRVEARGTSGDVTVLLPVRTGNDASISVLAHRPSGSGASTGSREDGFALLSLSPPASASSSVTPRDLTFVVDVSGSMQGKKLDQAKAAGRALLETLRPADRFRVIDFSTDVRSFRDGWTVASQENIRAAQRYLAGLRAEGSTNISEALHEALAGERRPRAGLALPLVVFLTDGEPTVGERNPDAIAAIAAKERGEARVFTVGISAAINTTLVEQMALQGRGTAQFVRDDESIESAVSLLGARLAQPVLTDVRITADGVRLSRLQPAGPIDVFAGQDLVVLARYSGGGTATVRVDARSANGPVTYSTRVRFADETRDNPFVARLWAAQRIGWLAAEKRRHGGTNEMNDEIRTLGERFGIPTEYSSYLVLEPGAVASGNGQAMDSMRRRDMGAAPLTSVVATAANAKAAGASAAPPAAAPMAQVQFEAARASAAQRDARSIAALDDAERGSGNGFRLVGMHRMTLANGVWRDARFTSDHRTVRVRPFSPLYFRLMSELPELQDVFALGERVLVAGRRVAIELAENGVERADDETVRAIRRDW